MGFLLVFIGPRVGVLNSFFARGVGNSPIKKNCPGRWSGLELTDNINEQNELIE